MGRDEYIKHEVKEITFLIIFGTTMVILLPIFFGFVLKAFEESFVSGRPLTFGDVLVTYGIYYIIILAGLLTVPALKIRRMFVTNKKEHPANQSKPDVFSVAIIHDPETDGLLYNLFNYLGYPNAMRWSQSMLRMFIIGTLVFGAVGLFQISTGYSFVDVPEMVIQQVTPTGEVFFSAEPPAFAETMMMILVLSLLMGLNAWFCSKFKLGKGVYFAIGITIIVLIIGLGWMGFHNIVYGNSEAKLTATFIFGTIGAFITILFGTFILWYTFHFWNNIFVKLGNMAIIREDIMFVAILLWILLFIISVSAEVLIYRFKKKREYSLPVPT